MTQHHPLTTALAERDAAPYIGYTPAALKLWRREGRGPAFIRHGRSIRYLARDLDAWMAAHRVETRASRQPVEGRVEPTDAEVAALARVLNLSPAQIDEILSDEALVSTVRAIRRGHEQ